MDSWKPFIIDKTFTKFQSKAAMLIINPKSVVKFPKLIGKTNERYRQMIIDELKEKITGKNVRIVFTEGWDKRVMGAAVALKKDNVLEPVLLGEVEDVQKLSLIHI